MKQSVLTAMAILAGSLIGAAITILVLNKKHEPKKPVYVKSTPCKECEYLFTVTDDSITVYDRLMDCERVVGTVKLEGQLDSLITLDNQ